MTFDHIWKRPVITLGMLLWGAVAWGQTMPPETTWGGTYRSIVDPGMGGCANCVWVGPGLVIAEREKTGNAALDTAMEACDRHTYADTDPSWQWAKCKDVLHDWQAWRDARNARAEAEAAAAKAERDAKDRAAVEAYLAGRGR